MPAIRKDDIETPALILDLDILEENIRKMSAYLEDKNAKLRPHYKTHKCPTIAHMQIRAGAKGVSCAKLGEAETLAFAGIHDILIANQVVDSAKIHRLAALANNNRITVCVDNKHNITELSQAAKIYGSTIYILVEIDIGMRRCGVDTKEEALELAELVCKSEGLIFEGLQAYSGQINHMIDFNERVESFQKANKKITEAKNYLEANGICIKEISGVSTGGYNIFGENTIWTEMQTGSYVFMDTSYDTLGLEFKKALSVLTTVIHKQPGSAVTDAGIKACSTDNGLPVIRDHPGLGMVLNEEHGKIQDINDELRYLQKIEYYPSHSCTTVNLYDNFHCVRKGLLEAIWPISGRGKGC